MMRLTFHSSLALIAMMTFPQETQSIKLGSIGDELTMDFSQIGAMDDDDGIPDYAALSQAWNEAKNEAKNEKA